MSAVSTPPLMGALLWSRRRETDRRGLAVHLWCSRTGLEKHTDTNWLEGVDSILRLFLSPSGLYTSKGGSWTHPHILFNHNKLKKLCLKNLKRLCFNHIMHCPFHAALLLMPEQRGYDSKFTVWKKRNYAAQPHFFVFYCFYEGLCLAQDWV